MFSRRMKADQKEYLNGPTKIVDGGLFESDFYKNLVVSSCITFQSVVLY